MMISWLAPRIAAPYATSVAVISLAAIAKEAGVSRMTVSRVLRGRSEVAAETRQAVESAAARLGWQPNPEIGRLMGALRATSTKEATQTLALVWPDATRQQIAARMTLRMLRDGVRTRAAALGFGLDEFFLGSKEMNSRQLNRVLTARGIESLIVAPVSFRAHGHAAIDWTRYSSVVVGAGFVGPAVNRVHNHHFATLRLAMRELRRLGYRRVGFLSDPVLSSRLDRVMEAAFLMHHPLPPREAAELIYPLRDWKEERFAKWVKARRVDAVIGELPTPDWVAKSLAPAGMKVPDDFGYCSFNWMPDNPETSGVNQRFDTIGAAAVDAVTALFARHERGSPQVPKTILTTPEWVAGKTLRCRNA
jgi:DNA-binding LacI/PurR family transcriptional regulator